MKNLIPALSLLLLCACNGPSRVENAEVPANYKLIAKTTRPYLRVYTVEIEGKTYVIAWTSSGVAICPKAP